MCKGDIITAILSRGSKWEMEAFGKIILNTAVLFCIDLMHKNHTSSFPLSCNSIGLPPKTELILS